MEEKSFKRGQQELCAAVIHEDLCTGCGACIDLCPYFRSYRGKTAALFPCDIEEGRCFAYCPKVDADLDELSVRFFGVPYGSAAMGAVQSVWAVHAGPRMKLSNAQAGGAVSSLMYYALEKGAIEGAVLTDRQGLLPLPRYVKGPADVVACASSKYTAAPTVSAVNRAVAEGAKNIGFVGTPCQVLATALMRSKGLHEEHGFDDPFGIVVGLFCTWAIDYRRFEPFIEGRTNITGIKKIDIPPPPAEVLEVFGEDGAKTSIPLEDIRPLVPHGCSYCIDMTSEFADISVGVMEGRPDMNTLIIRTDRGKNLVDRAVNDGYLEISEMPEEPLAHLQWAAANKKRRALSRARAEDMINCNGSPSLFLMRMRPDVLDELTI